MTQNQFVTLAEGAYVLTMLWSETDDSGEPLNRKYSVADITEDAYHTMISGVDAFVRANWSDVRNFDPKYVGHDFALTRNGHGAGFWDGDYPEPAAGCLTAASHECGEQSLYVGDDGRLHVA
jgi:hypothetical protein